MNANAIPQFPSQRFISTENAIFSPEDDLYLINKGILSLSCKFFM